MPEGVPQALREYIAAEAGYRCGYWLTDQRVSGAQMHIEHPIPRAQGGRSVRTNVWLSCAWCNIQGYSDRSRRSRNRDARRPVQPETPTSIPTGSSSSTWPSACRST